MIVLVTIRPDDGTEGGAKDASGESTGKTTTRMMCARFTALLALRHQPNCGASATRGKSYIIRSHRIGV